MSDRNSKSGKSPPNAAQPRARSPEMKRVQSKVGLSMLRERAGSPAIVDRPQFPAPSFESFVELVRKDDTGVITDVLVHHPSVASLRNATNNSALHVAAAENKCGAVRALVGAGWKDQILNTTNDEGWTPLMLAASAGHHAVCKLLLDAGAYAQGATRSQTTALHYVARWLPDKELDTATIISILDNLLVCGAQVNAANAHGITPLHDAAQLGNHDVVRFLLKRGANPSLADKFGQTAHALAARKGFTEVCRAFADWDEKQREAKEREKEKEFVQNLPISDEDRKRMELDSHSSLRHNPLTGDRRVSIAPTKGMALTMALYTGPDRPSSPSVPPVPPVSASAPASSPLAAAAAASNPFALPLAAAAVAAGAPNARTRMSSPPTSPKGVLIHHGAAEAEARVASPRRSVNMALAALVAPSAQHHAAAVVSPPRTIPAPAAAVASGHASLNLSGSAHPLPPSSASAGHSPLNGSGSAHPLPGHSSLNGSGSAHPLPGRSSLNGSGSAHPLGASSGHSSLANSTSSAHSPPTALASSPPLAKAPSPPLPKGTPPPVVTSLPVTESKEPAKAEMRLSAGAKDLAAMLVGPEHQEWLAFLGECGIPSERCPRYALWLVKEGVEVEWSRDLPDDLMKLLTFSNLMTAPDLVTLYKRYWTLRGSSLK